jgi:hypothetical protein
MTYLFQTNTVHRATTTTGSLVVQEGWGPGAAGQHVWEQAGGGGLRAASHGGCLRTAPCACYLRAALHCGLCIALHGGCLLCSVAWHCAGVVFVQHCAGVVFMRYCVSAWCGAVVVFARRCMAVVFMQCRIAWRASLRGIALRRRCLRVVLHGCRLRAVLHSVIFTRRLAAVVFAQRCVAVSSCHPGVVIVRPVFMCHCMAVVFASPLLSGRCHLHRHGHCCCLVTEGQRYIPCCAPTNSGGCAGAGRKRGDSHAPASARTRGRKRGWQLRSGGA